MAARAPLVGSPALGRYFLPSAARLCDAACWQKTPFKIGTRLSLRDLWAHAPPKEPSLAHGLVVPEPLTLELGGYWDESRVFKVSPLPPPSRLA